LLYEPEAIGAGVYAPVGERGEGLLYFSAVSAYSAVNNLIVLKFLLIRLN
jgi:hypothetical protein